MIRPETLTAVKNHAENEAPFECCGAILEDGSIKSCRNWAKHRERAFEIDAKELLRIRRNGVIIGIYHSHVGSVPVPSVADETGASYPGLFYVIAGVANGRCDDIRVYRYADPASDRHFELMKPKESQP